jgi:hypothetical protein
MQSCRASTRRFNLICETTLPLWITRLFDLQFSAELSFCHVFDRHTSHERTKKFLGAAEKEK